MHSLMPSANRASAAFAGGDRLLLLGGSPPQIVKHVLEFVGEAKDVIRGFVAESQHDQNFQEFGTGVVSAS